MGREFLSGYISLADGEKDPRNLLLAFAIGRVILVEFKIEGFVEVMEIIFVQFSSSPRRVPNSPYSTLRSVIFLSLIDSRRTTRPASRRIC